jgi:hypothetical protein
MGELSAQTLKARGVLGYVVDGGSRAPSKSSRPKARCAAR